MSKVYLVIEEITFNGDPNHNVTCCGTYDKAVEIFNRLVEKEKESSYIRDEDYTELDESEDYFHWYDDVNFDSTTIFITEREIL